MKLTPSILTASEASESSEASLFSEASLARASSVSSDSSLSSLASSPRNRAPLVGASIKGSVTPSIKGSATPKTVFASRSLLSSGSSRRQCVP